MYVYFFNRKLCNWYVSNYLHLSHHSDMSWMLNYQAYLDDPVEYLFNRSEYLACICDVFSHVCNASLLLNSAKCELAKLQSLFRETSWSDEVHPLVNVLHTASLHGMLLQTIQFIYHLFFYICPFFGFNYLLMWSQKCLI